MKASWIVLLALILILAAAAGYLGYSYLGLTGKPGATPSPVALIQQPVINTYEGTVEPMPYLPDDPYRDPDGPTEGLKLNNGDFYAMVGNIDGSLLIEGKKISVAGTVDASVTIPHYDIKGVIRVSRMTSL